MEDCVKYPVPREVCSTSCVRRRQAMCDEGYNLKFLRRTFENALKTEVISIVFTVIFADMARGGQKIGVTRVKAVTCVTFGVS